MNGVDNIMKMQVFTPFRRLSNPKKVMYIVYRLERNTLNKKNVYKFTCSHDCMVSCKCTIH
jgi:hypothetical protein